MLDELDIYARKLAAAGLCEPGAPVLGFLDDRLAFNREAPENAVLAGVFERMGINSLLWLPLGEPYATIVDFLAGRSGGAILPRDCETRTFLHDLPVVESFDAATLAEALSRRKSVIVRGRGVLAHGAVSPEQAFVSASSVCFASFVKFFSDYLALKREGRSDPAYEAAFHTAKRFLAPPRTVAPELAEGPFETREQALAAMDAAGKATVGLGLVDSFFGNISCNLDGVLLISQTGSSLDELPDCVDPCHLDGSSCAGLTASSELTAHQAIVALTGAGVILHGHPRFAVILSMDCDVANCPDAARCHVDCSRPRFLGERGILAEIPVVPGEVGTGPRGLVNTLPPAMLGRRGAVVLGHGLFATGRTGFREAFDTLLSVENACREEYFRRVESFGG
ncbi:class II aldolase/adducin family protein [Fundidesulfovibrio soli]|uniref:class II aldolase/adducin family protein n=1 Tax=Fundidesulfovibrio soli TaxID=2922716 RepID=UPI001FAEDCCB|nr:class II aldolase/adducin family protein [Fundidesulfovibrio soli]